jgi:HK97 family phage prohead protease
VKIKSCPVRIKAAGENEGTEDGVFEAIVAAYNTDSVGDRIVPGAFAETLAEWKGRGDPIPVLWSHMSADPEYHIGVVEEAEERPEGLWVRARLDLDEPKAAKVYRLLKGRRVTQFSFAYDIEEGSPVEVAEGESYYELRKLRLYEVGPTLIGANQATELLDVKAADHGPVQIAIHNPPGADIDGTFRKAMEELIAHHTKTSTPAPEPAPSAPAAETKAEEPEVEKAGRTLSAKNEERVKEIARLAKELLDSVASENASSDDDEKARPDAQPATPEEPSQAKGDEPARHPRPASLRLSADLAALAAEVSELT